MAMTGMMTGVKRILAGAGLALIMASAAAAQTTNSFTADELELILTEAGLSPTMTEDAKSRTPMAYGNLGQTNFWVRALECSGAPASCKTLVFFLNFELGRQPAQTDYRAINAFNERQVFGRAYIVENKKQVGVDYVIELEGGVTMDHVTRNIERWADVVAAFLDSMGAGQASS